MQKCETCGKDYKNLAAHQRSAHAEPLGEKALATLAAEETTAVPTAPAPSSMEAMMGEVLGMVRTISQKQEAADKRLDRIETGGANDFKHGKTAEDVAAAEQSKENINPRVVQIVEETLGDDFRVQMRPQKDRPGLEFTVIVPPRLSDLASEERPIIDPESTHPRHYKLDQYGEVIFETYHPEDRRTRAVSSTDSYDVIREHCERIRAHIIATFQKTNRPVPEFKLRQSVRL